jgi:hypothetical protein
MLDTEKVRHRKHYDVWIQQHLINVIGYHKHGIESIVVSIASKGLDTIVKALNSGKQSACH